MTAASKAALAETPRFVGGSDNGWNVDYAESVVNVIRSVGGAVRVRPRLGPFAPAFYTQSPAQHIDVSHNVGRGRTEQGDFR